MPDQLVQSVVAPLYPEFSALFPEYEATSVLDAIRQKDFARLDEQNHVYLDYTGGNLYPLTLIDEHHSFLKNNILGNPHSSNPASKSSTVMVDASREFVLEYFNAKDDYFCIFTANCSAALKIVGESYPFDNKSHFLLSIDNHNSVNGIREFAKRKGAGFSYVPMDEESLCLDEDGLIRQLEAFPDCGNKLFAFPAQSNVTGIKHPLATIGEAKKRGWDVLLDAAAFVPSDRLDLKEVKPDFVTISFYKIFGYPTGVGCLLVRKESFSKLDKPWFAGGTISIAATKFDGHMLIPNHEKFEDGTINYLDIPAIKNGLAYIQKLGLLNIKKRTSALAQWMLSELTDLKHSNGYRLIQILGAPDANKRGATIAMQFYNKEGNTIPYLAIEKEANKRMISLRSGCFCNPGIDETVNHIEKEKLKSYFATHTDWDIDEMMSFIGKVRGSVRISFGLASNFKDAMAFYSFAKSFIDK